VKTIFSEDIDKSVHLNSEEVFVFPVSFAQQQLWFLEQLEPGTPFYTLPLALKLRGNLNLAILERSLNELIQRHETLRTSLQVIDGKPVQVITPSAKIGLAVTDLRNLADREAQAEQIAAKEAQTPFILSQSPLMRVQLLRLESAEYILLITLHHAIADGWSMGVLLEELAALYAAFKTETLPNLPELPLQYADFTLWQQETPSSSTQFSGSNSILGFSTKSQTAA
jgi:hypothetical protein